MNSSLVSYCLLYHCWSGSALYLPLLLSDLLCVHREDHPFLYQVLLRAIRPLEITCFALLLEGLSRDPSILASLIQTKKKEEEASPSDEQRNMGIYKKRDLISSIKEAAMRTQNSSRGDTSTPRKELSENLGSLLVAASPFLTTLPETVVSRSSFPPQAAASVAVTEGEAEDLLSDYLGKVLGLAVETFRAMVAERLRHTGR